MGKSGRRVLLVLDTNVVLSALLWRGTPFRLLEAIRDKDDARLFSSPALLHELTDVLLRPSMTGRMASIGVHASEIVSAYLEIVELVEPAEVPAVIVKDPADDHVIAAAVAAGADWIVSGDKRHLLALGEHRGIAIISAADALARFGSIGTTR